MMPHPDSERIALAALALVALAIIAMVVMVVVPRDGGAPPGTAMPAATSEGPTPTRIVPPRARTLAPTSTPTATSMSAPAKTVTTTPACGCCCECSSSTPTRIATFTPTPRQTLRPMPRAVTLSVSVYVPRAGGINGRYGKTASGIMVRRGIAACGPSWAFGTVLVLPAWVREHGLPRVVVCLDRGGLVSDRHLDVALVGDVGADLRTAREWGRRVVVVEVDP